MGISYTSHRPARYLSFKKVFTVITLIAFLLGTTPYYIDKHGKYCLCKFRAFLSLVYLTLASLLCQLLYIAIIRVPEDIGDNPFALLSYGHITLVGFILTVINYNICFSFKKFISAVNDMSYIYGKLKIGESVKTIVFCLLLFFIVTICECVGLVITIRLHEEPLPFAARRIVATVSFLASGSYFSLIILLALFLWSAVRKVHNRLQRVGLRDDYEISTVSSNKRNQKPYPSAAYNELEDILETYRNVQKLKEKLNKVFSLQILCNVLLVFIEVVYFVFVTIVVLQTGGFESIQQFVIVYAYLFVIVAKLVALVGACNVFTTTSLATGILAHRVRRQMRSDYSRDQLTSFSQELLHDRPQITACGFFNVDFTLIYNVVGAISMYLIIMIQFNFTSSKKSAAVLMRFE